MNLLVPSARAIVFVVAVALTAIVKAETVITFDDIPLNTGTGAFLPSNYQGLVWSNFGVGNGILNPNKSPFTNGFYYGVFSLSNVAYNAFGDPSEIVSGTNFNFLSAYLTGGWRSNQSIEVQGFLGNSLMYDQTVTASATNSSPFMFHYMNIDRLHFTSFGGDSAFSFDGGAIMVMDNFAFEFVPEPSTILLTSIGITGLWIVRRRKQA